MKNVFPAAFALLAWIIAAAPSAAQTVLGGARMNPSEDIVHNAVKSMDLTTFIAALLATDLLDTLKRPGPFTVFAPTNKAFGMLPPPTVETLLNRQNKARLAHLLTYHVVPGRLDAAALTAMVKAAGGRAQLQTLEGESLVVTAATSGSVLVSDAHGGTATVTIADVYQSSGVMHVIDKVLLPK